MLRIAIVDDHQLVRAGFRELLGSEVDLRVVFDAASGEEALERLRAEPCDVLLLDLSLPGKSGVDVLRNVRQRHPDVAVLVLSGFPEDRYALAMIRNGASGYICKDCEQDELVRAVHTVASGRRYLSPRTAELLAAEMLGDGAAAPHTGLSEREMQVFLRLARGETVSDIAATLNLSVKTVSTYRTRLLEKLELGSNAELAAYALRNGLMLE